MENLGKDRERVRFEAVMVRSTLTSAKAKVRSLSSKIDRVREL